MNKFNKLLNRQTICSNRPVNKPNYQKKCSNIQCRLSPQIRKEKVWYICSETEHHSVSNKKVLNYKINVKGREKHPFVGFLLCNLFTNRKTTDAN